MRLQQGDTVQLVQMAGDLVDRDWVRISAWTPNFDNRLIALDVGTDPDIGGFV